VSATSRQPLSVGAAGFGQRSRTMGLEARTANVDDVAPQIAAHEAPNA
jgi:hypothetical protein